MANDQKKIENQTEEKAQSVKAAPASKIAIVLSVLSICLVLAVGVAGYWFYLQQAQAQQKVIADFSAISAENSQLSNALANSSQQISALKNQQKSLQSALNTSQTQLKKLAEKQDYSSAELLAEWSLHEVHFLLDVANQRAILSKDILGAKAALTMADDKIVQINDYRLHPLRALIAKEILALDSVAKVDLAGIGLKLQSAVTHVDTLRVKKGPQVKLLSADIDITDETMSAEQQSRWQQAVSDIWQEMRSLVVIRHDEEAESAVLVPEQRYFLYQNLKLQLESARLSLLNADAEAYKASLQTAISWLQKYFVGDETQALLNQLAQLQNQSVTISVPDISASLNWMQEYQQ